MVDRGHGPTVLMIPSIQGRWKWMSPVVDAVTTRCHGSSSSLTGDRGNLRSIDATHGFDDYLGWVDELLYRTGIKPVSVFGIWSGGFVALRGAAHRPECVKISLQVPA